VLASETLLLPASGKGAGANKLTIETATALELGLPIYGSLNLSVPDTSEQVPGAPVGVTFRLEQNAGGDATIYVVDTQNVVQNYTLKPGIPLPFPNRSSVQMALSVGGGRFTPWETIGAGAYILSWQGGVWQTAAETSRIVIDNSANGYPFQYRIGGNVGTVPARQVVPLDRLTAVTPIEFDRGIGGAIATKVLSGKDARFVVRAATSGGLDLFEPDSPLSNDAPALADARVVPAAIGSAPSGATPRSATPPDGMLETIRPRFPVGTLDE
jgi:hypothetical protein